MKWLLVDALVDLERGEPGRLEVVADRAWAGSVAGLPILGAANTRGFDWSRGFAHRLAPPEEGWSRGDEAVLGTFAIDAGDRDGDGEPEVYKAEDSPLRVETEGPVRAVLLQRGHYRSAHSTKIGEFTTRYTLLRDQPYVRVTHTVVWGRQGERPWLDAPRDEDGFDYERAPRFVEFTAPTALTRGAARFDVGLTSGDAVALAPDEDGAVRQSSRAEVEVSLGPGGPSVREDALDGSLTAFDGSGRPSLFVGMRWAAEQFPSGFALQGGTPRIRLLDPEGATWWQLNSNDDTDADATDFVATPHRKGPESALGVAKTYELLVWPGDEEVASDVKRAMAEGGVVAFADPKFVVKSGLPVAMSARAREHTDAGPRAEKLATVERALEDLFAFATRSHNPGADAERQSRFGALHFGDVVMDWDLARPELDYAFPGKYWMNTGTGWSSVPWILWMRSGARTYRDFAEANARHVMDVDTSHVTRIVNTLYKVRGGQGQYSDTHGAFLLPQSWGASLLSKNEETEGISLAYTLAGDERGRDVLRERAESLVDAWSDPEHEVHTLLTEITDPSSPRPFGFDRGGSPGSGDGPQAHYRAVVDFAVLSELFGDELPELREAGEAYLDAVLATQGDDGWFPGGRPISLDYGLLLAARAFPERREACLSALARWALYRGRPAEPSASGKALGPTSQAAALALFRQTGDPRVVADSQSVVYAQAASVLGRDSAIDAGAVWRGMSPNREQSLGQLVRGWVGVLALERRGYVFDPEPPPMPYLKHLVTGEHPAADPVEVTRVYALKDADEELSVDFDFSLYQNGGDQRRAIDVVMSGDDVAVHHARCISWRGARFGEAHLGWQQPLGVGPCAEGPTPTESFGLVSPNELRGVAGAIRLDVTMPRFDGLGLDPEKGLNPLALSARAKRVRTSDNGGLRVAPGSIGASAVATTRVSLHEGTTLLARILHEEDGEILAKGQEYALRVDGGRASARFTLHRLTDVVPLVVELELPRAGGPLSLVATLRADSSRPVAVASLCADAADEPLCATASIPTEGHLVLTSDAPLRLGSGGFGGLIDEARVLPRVLLPEEQRSFLLRHEDAIDLAELGGGEAFLFDDEARSESGDGELTLGSSSSLELLHAVPGAGLVRVARLGELVYYDPSQDVRAYDPPRAPCVDDQPYGTLDQCALRAANDRVVGMVFGEPRGDAPVSLKMFDYRLGAFGVVDADGLALPLVRLDERDVPAHGALFGRAPVDVSPRGLWFSAESIAGAGFPFGWAPYFAQRRAALFDPLSCEDHRRVAVPNGAGYFVLSRAAAPGGGMILSAKLWRPADDQSASVLDAPGWGTLELDGDALRAQVATRSGGPVALSARLPPEAWISARLEVVPIGSGRIDAALYLNDRRVDHLDPLASLPATREATEVFVGGRSVAEGFDGAIDDVTLLAQGEGEALSPWYTCRAGGFGSFEDDVSGMGSAAIIDR